MKIKYIIFFNLAAFIQLFLPLNMLAQNGTTRGKCDMPRDSIMGLISMMKAGSKNVCPDKAISFKYIDTLMMQPGFNFFTEVKMQGPLPVDDAPLLAKLDRGFKSIKAGNRTMLDSLLILTNFVYYYYPYEHPNEQLQYTDCDSIAPLLNRGLINGLCGDLAYFEAMVIRKYFPNWGVPLQLQTNTDRRNKEGSCGIRHILLGLANTRGEVTVLADPTVNAVWCDSLTGAPIDLKTAKAYLKNKNNAYRVVKKCSVFFGRYHSELMHDGSLCEFTIMFEYGNKDVPVAYATDNTYQNLLVRGPFVNFDYRDPLRGNPQQDYYWKKMYIPREGWGWQDNLLFIRNAVTYDNAIAPLVSKKYKMPVSTNK